MWTTSFTGTTTATPKAVWGALEALHSGVALGEGSDRFELHGSFAVGTRMTITPAGQDPCDSVVTELTPGRVYADRTEYDGLVLTFRHRIRPVGDGAEVEHVLEIDGDAADEAGPELGPQISGDFPVAMRELLAAAERGVHV